MSAKAQGVLLVVVAAVTVPLALTGVVVEVSKGLGLVVIVVAVASVWMVLAALASYRSENLAMSMVMVLVSALLVGGCVGYLWLEERFPLPHSNRCPELDQWCDADFPGE